MKVRASGWLSMAAAVGLATKDGSWKGGVTGGTVSGRRRPYR